MGQYDNRYNSSYGSTQAKRQSLIRIIVRVLFAIVSVVAFVALVLTHIAPHISPEVWWGFPVLGLIAPAVYLANFIIAMVWLMRWRWKVALPIVVMLVVGFDNITRFVKMDIYNHYGEPNHRGKIKFLSYNLRYHFNDDQDWSTEQIAQYLDSIAPDIFCLQELRGKRFEDELPIRFQKYDKVINTELGIYSRYPIVAQSETISEKELTTGYRSMWVDIKISNDTIRVFNNHLQSTSINQNDDKYITSREFVADSLREEKFTDIISRFKNSSIKRARQADSLAHSIGESPYEVVVCGDFNDTPMSYTYRVISHGLKDSFQECGVGFPYTFRGFMNTLRIDYILASEGISFESYMVDKDILISDHLPVITHFTLTK